MQDNTPLPALDTLVWVVPLTGIETALTYRVPDELGGRVSFGKRVLIPLASRVVTGLVVGQGERFEGTIKDVIDVLDTEPLLDATTLDFYRFIADYYSAPLGEVIRKALPPGFAVATRRVVRTVGSPEGTTEVERLIIELAARPGGITVGGLARRLSDSATGHHLSRLSRAGAVVIEDLPGKSGPRRGSVRVVRKREGDRAEGWERVVSRSPKAREILALVEESGRLEYRLLTERWGNVSGQIRRLEKIGAVEVVTEYRERTIDVPDIRSQEPERLSPAQEEALAQITESIGRPAFSVWLLFGVTGSGKTEVYIRAAQEALARGKGVLVLVPEISLTPQLLSRFASRLGDTVALFHSGLSPGERLDQWWRVRGAKARVVIGARSALFAPLADPGVVIVDEEHDPSYKQSETPRYHARDAAVMLGRLKGCAVILGSATPSLESMENVHRGRFRLATLPERVTKVGRLPEVEIVDLREAPFATRNITEPLANGIRETLAAHRQAILLLNRRGFSSFILCPLCGHSFPCPSCSITLTYHKGPRILLCHYCGYCEAAPDVCPKCGSYNLSLMGAGVERVQEEIAQIVPGAAIARLDRDTARKKGEAARILSAFSHKKADILIGTQMVAKGHDFPEVALVGVVNADIALNLPDFRSSERTFTLLTQAAGRAGRGDAPSTVVIQTYNPNHYAIRAAATHDWAAFAQEERESRRELFYPPFSRLVLIRLTAPNEVAVRRESANVRDELDRLIASRKSGVLILGPAPSPIARMMDRYRWQVLLKGEKRRELFDLLRAARLDGGIKQRGGVTISVDIDPMDML
jgi:primosomal protein N' (replication factor Y)